MFKKFRDLIAGIVIYFLSKIAKLLYKDEITQMETLQKTILETQLKESSKSISGLKQEMSKLGPEYVNLFDKYTGKQNELLTVFIEFLKEMQHSERHELEAYANLWATTTDGLTRTLSHAFSQQSVDDVKKSLKLIQQDLEASMLGSDSSGTPGGFNYSGPIGEA
jgi:molecular chaperone GrpE (heat shock protein)